MPDPRRSSIWILAVLVLLLTLITRTPADEVPDITEYTIGTASP
jgi:hypothetical protein